MRLVHAADLEAQDVIERGAEKVKVRWLLSRPEGAPTFAMRLFELAPGGYTPLHEHAWEHEVYVIEGQLEVVGTAGPTNVTAADAILVLPNETHRFRNVGDTAARFLCMIPLPD